MKSILSTKKLLPNQRDLVLGQGFRLVDYDAIHIEFTDFEVPSHIRNAIFTSQNGVRSTLRKTLDIERCFCVGEKTASLLEENGQNVIKKAENSEELGKIIENDHKNDTFYYFCGSKRRDELPDILKSVKINFSEVTTYKTTLHKLHFDQKWDGILFFSPSGVESFMLENSLENSVAICIGDTTAATAKKHTDALVIANAPTVESVIAKAVKTLAHEHS